MQPYADLMRNTGFSAGSQGGRLSLEARRMSCRKRPIHDARLLGRTNSKEYKVSSSLVSPHVINNLRRETSNTQWRTIVVGQQRYDVIGRNVSRGKLDRIEFASAKDKVRFSNEVARLVSRLQNRCRRLVERTVKVAPGKLRLIRGYLRDRRQFLQCVRSILTEAKRQPIRKSRRGNAHKRDRAYPPPSSKLSHFCPTLFARKTQPKIAAKQQLAQP